MFNSMKKEVTNPHVQSFLNFVKIKNKPEKQRTLTHTDRKNIEMLNK